MSSELPLRRACVHGRYEEHCTSCGRVAGEHDWCVDQGNWHLCRESCEGNPQCSGGVDVVPNYEGAADYLIEVLNATEASGSGWDSPFTEGLAMAISRITLGIEVMEETE